MASQSIPLGIPIAVPLQYQQIHYSQPSLYAPHPSFPPAPSVPPCRPPPAREPVVAPSKTVDNSQKKQPEKDVVVVDSPPIINLWDSEVISREGDNRPGFDPYFCSPLPGIRQTDNQQYSPIQTLGHSSKKLSYPNTPDKRPCADKDAQ